MMEKLATNNHLKKVIEDIKVYLEKGEDAPLELMFKFICELKVSNLLVPAISEGEYVTFENIVSDEDESTFIPLFTDIEEYNKHESGEEEFIPTAFDFDVYKELVLEDNLDGVVINVEGDFLPLDYEFIKELEYDIDTLDDEDITEYSAEELKDIFETVSNESLVEFINSPLKNDIERLYAELSDSVLLNVVISAESLDEIAEDGIIDVNEAEELSLCAIEDENFSLGTIFTDKQAIDKIISQEPDYFYYGQITILSELFDYVLRNDMDGVILNPNGDDYIIARDDILPQASGIEVIVETPKFKKSMDYAFLL